MAEQRLDAEVGTVVHRLVAAAVTDDLTLRELRILARRIWQARPVGGASAPQTRARATTLAAVYLTRLQVAGWELIGVEVVVPGARADLVWFTPDGRIVIEELKTGRDVTAADIDQVERLELGGTAEWGDRFGGVRLCRLRRPSRSGFVTVTGGQLVSVEEVAS